MKLETNNFYDRGYGGVFGLISILIALIGIAISYSTYPGYIIGYYNVSLLGVGRLGISFNIGSILSGLVAIPYYLNLSRHFQAEGADERMVKASIISSMGSCFGYIFVGIFPVIKSISFFYFAHFVFALIAFLSGAVYLCMYAYMMYLSESFTEIHAIHSLIVCFFYLAFVFTQISFFEWIALFGLISWISVNSISLLLLKHRH